MYNTIYIWWKKSNLSWIIIVWIIITCTQNTLAQSSTLPNIIIIVADDLGYNDLISYRDLKVKSLEKLPTSNTPNIDKIAAEGMRFTDFYAGASVCSPSRASLLTGRNASRLGIYNYIPPNSPMHLRSSELTIAELLKAKGYSTGHFGKWHLSSDGMNQPGPNEQGYGYSFYTLNNAIPSHKDPINFKRNSDGIGKVEGYASHIVADEAIEWMEQEKDAPFYLNLWFHEPHVELAAPDSLIKRHAYNKEYYAAIENMDYAVKKITDFLERQNLSKNTLVIFTSDNGSQWMHSNDPLRGFKAFNYEGGIRVPFVVKWPQKILPNSVSNFAGSFTDILPTLAEITSSVVPEEITIDGISLYESFIDPKSQFERKNPLLFFRYFNDPILSMRSGDWVLIGSQEKLNYAEEMSPVDFAFLKPFPGAEKNTFWSFNERHMNYLENSEPKYFELYNIKNDPGQVLNLADEFPIRVRKLKKIMHALKKEMLKEGGNWFKK